MILLILFIAIGVLLVWMYFRNQDRQSDQAWRRFRQRARERRDHPPPDQPLDPNFQFDEPRSQPDELPPQGPT